MNILAKIKLLQDQRHSPDGADEAFGVDVEREADTLVARLISKVKKIDWDLEGIKLYREEIKSRETKLKRKREHTMDFIIAILDGLSRHGGGDQVHWATLVRRETQRVEVDDKKLVPPRFMKIREVPEVDKTAVKEHINAGGHVTGTHIVTTKQSIRIRKDKKEPNNA